jgi:hypothetical protein
LAFLFPGLIAIKAESESIDKRCSGACDKQVLDSSNLQQKEPAGRMVVSGPTFIAVMNHTQNRATPFRALTESSDNCPLRRRRRNAAGNGQVSIGFRRSKEPGSRWRF